MKMADTMLIKLIQSCQLLDAIRWSVDKILGKLTTALKSTTESCN